MNQFVQIMIFVLGSLAIWLIARTDKWSKYGYVLGLCSQPFWFYIGICEKQWGIVAVGCVYTYSWCLGIYNNWSKKIRENRNNFSIYNKRKL